MQLITLGVGFFIAIALFSLFGQNGKPGCIVTFLAFWAIGAIGTFFVLVIAGFLLKFIIIIAIILFIISLFKRKTTE